jgi:hypothetical protein
MHQAIKQVCLLRLCGMSDDCGCLAIVLWRVDDSGLGIVFRLSIVPSSDIFIQEASGLQVNTLIIVSFRKDCA